jgi:hypothetical protein
MGYARKICYITAVGLVGLAALFVVMGLGNSLLMTSYLITAGGLVTGALICVAVGVFIGNLGGDSKLLQTGTPGMAVVTSVAETGMVINYSYHVLNIGLRVQVGAGTPYDVVVRQTVPIIMMARVQPGATLGVKVDPTDQTKVVIDFSMVPGVNMPGVAVPGSPGPVPGASPSGSYTPPPPGPYPQAPVAPAPPPSGPWPNA